MDQFLVLVRAILSHILGKKEGRDLLTSLLHSPGGGGTPLCDLNGDVRPDRVWFSGCFVLNGVSVSSLSVLNRVSLQYLMA